MKKYLIFFTLILGLQLSAQVRFVDLIIADPKTTAELNALPAKVKVEGAIAWNTETKTIWVYHTGVWNDTSVGVGGGGSADGVISNVALSGTYLVFTGVDGGFNGSVPLATFEDNLPIHYNDILLTSAPTRLNFKGAGVSLSSPVSNQVDITINGDGVGTDDQTASEVPVSPAVNSFTNAQAVLEDHEARIDALASGGADGVVSGVSLVGTNLTFTGSGGAFTGPVSLASLQDGTGTDDQIAVEVPFTPTGNTVANNLQAAIVELQTEIDGSDLDPSDDVVADSGSPVQNLSVWYGTKAQYKAVPPGPSVDAVFITDSIQGAPEIDYVTVTPDNGARFRFPVQVPEGAKFIDTLGFQGVGITEVILPSTLDSIGSSAFKDNKLSSIVIPASVKKVQSSAFMTNALGAITLNEGLVTIEDYAFSTQLSTGQGDYDLVIPNTVTSIGDYAFQSTSLTSQVGPGSLSLGQGVVSIGTGAFRSGRFSSLVIPNSVTSIGSSAFSQGAITSVSFGTGLTKLPSGFMAQNRGIIPSLNIPGHITVVGSSAFLFAGVQSLTLNTGLTEIGSSAFDGNSITSVVIPSTVTTVGISAFRDNPLTSITIPSSVTNLDVGVFQGTTGDYTITWQGGLGIASLPSFFTSDNTALTSFAVPSGISSIGDYAFRGCTSLASVTVPATVTSIGFEAFKNTALTAISLPTGVTLSGGEAGVFDAGVTVTYY